jgi:hypothetical protein
LFDCPSIGPIFDQSSDVPSIPRQTFSSTGRSL